MSSSSSGAAEALGKELTPAERRKRALAAERAKFMARNGAFVSRAMVSATPSADLRPVTPQRGPLLTPAVAQSVLQLTPERRAGAAALAASAGDSSDESDIEEVQTTPMVELKAMAAFQESGGAAAAAAKELHSPVAPSAPASAAPASAAAGAGAAAASAASSAAAAASSRADSSEHSESASASIGPLDANQLRTYVTQTAQRGTLVQMFIMRERGGLKKFYPEYRLFFKEGNRLCMAARKRKKNKTANYVISCDAKDTKRGSTSVVGKLRANFLGTEFTLYDVGDSFSTKARSGPLRQELASIFFEPNIMGSKGPRKMEVLTPAMTENRVPLVVQPTNADETIAARRKKGQTKDLVSMQNKQPQWNEETQSYVLNFRGRVTVASVKNFQLVHPDHPDYVVLQFGKCGKDYFTMDFQYPLSALQAFGICLSSLDNKLACE